MTPEPAPQHFRAVVIGAGFGGLAAAHALKRAGEDFVVLEREQEIGGVWRDNTYPGCACDIPSHLYSLSFAPNPHWTQAFSPQAEIRDYLRRVARDHALLPYIRPGTSLLEADWDEPRSAGACRPTPGRCRRTSSSTPPAPSRTRRPRICPACPASPARCSTPPAGATTSTWPAATSSSSAPAHRRSSSSRRSSRTSGG